MGTWGEYTCQGCNYQARVSGKRDWGFTVAVKTVVCERCKTVQDEVVNDVHPFDRTKDLPIRSVHCSECSGPVKLWRGYKCPRCGRKMEVPELSLPIMWD